MILRSWRKFSTYHFNKNYPSFIYGCTYLRYTMLYCQDKLNFRGFNIEIRIWIETLNSYYGRNQRCFHIAIDPITPKSGRIPVISGTCIRIEWYDLNGMRVDYGWNFSELPKRRKRPVTFVHFGTSDINYTFVIHCS